MLKVTSSSSATACFASTARRSGHGCGCGGGPHLRGRIYQDDEAHYRIGELGSGWAPVAVPDNDLASPNFGRVLESGPPRLLQFGVKVIY